MAVTDSSAEAAEHCVRVLKEWCLAYKLYDRKWKHLRHPVPETLPTDAELDMTCKETPAIGGHCESRGDG